MKLAVVLIAGSMLGCSASGEGGQLSLGHDGTGGGPTGPGPQGSGGGQTFIVGDGSSPSALNAHIESPPGVSVVFVTISCAGSCADVVAVAKGGFPPYSFTWEDGSTDPARHVCPTTTTEYRATVTDTGSASGELKRDPETVQAALTANVLACPVDAGTIVEGGVTNVDAGGAPCENASMPVAGRYVGNLTCPASTSSGGASGATGTLILDFAADGTGSVFFRWSLVVIGAQGALHPAGCINGAPGASWEGLWGVPGPSDPNNPNNPPALIPTGPITGLLTAVTSPGTPSSISGEFHWDAPPFGNQPASICHGAYTADKVP